MIQHAATRRPARDGFTLVELLVVITIILLVSVASIPVIMPALNERRVSSAALLLQAELTRARDTAVRANAPRGVRLMPDATGNLSFLPFRTPSATDYTRFLESTPAYTRMIAIEPGPDHTEGMVRGYNSAVDLLQLSAVFGGPPAALDDAVQKNWRTIWESKYTGATAPILPRSPTSWYWNVRRNDRIRIGNGRSWIIVGPMRIPQGPENPEGYINFGRPGDAPFPTNFVSYPGRPEREFLIVMDGEDNDSDGFVDEGFDGIDNNDDGWPDPGFVDNTTGLIGTNHPVQMEYRGAPAAGYVNLAAEIEPESTLDLGILDEDAQTYTIQRQPVPSQNARELSLPSGAAIDLTTWMAGQTPGMLGVPERSRLPVDRYSGYIDIMVAPNGQVVLPAAGRAVTPPPSDPYYHFWITDIEDIQQPDPLMLDANRRVPYATYLPLPLGTPGYDPADTTRALRGSRRLVSLNTRTGQVTTTSLETFDIREFNDTNLRPTSFTSPIRDLALGRVYRNAELGLKEAP
jgi:prepilin-type N-terminal cleavage/methylation domain-containing protein